MVAAGWSAPVWSSEGESIDWLEPPKTSRITTTRPTMRPRTMPIARSVQLIAKEASRSASRSRRAATGSGRKRRPALRERCCDQKAAGGDPPPEERARCERADQVTSRPPPGQRPEPLHSGRPARHEDGDQKQREWREREHPSRHRDRDGKRQRRHEERGGGGTKMGAGRAHRPGTVPVRAPLRAGAGRRLLLRPRRGGASLPRMPPRRRRRPHPRRPGSRSAARAARGPRRRARRRGRDGP